MTAAPFICKEVHAVVYRIEMQDLIIVESGIALHVYIVKGVTYFPIMYMKISMQMGFSSQNK